MKKITLLMVILMPLASFAESVVQIVQQNQEIKSAIQAFESNRKEKCDPITKDGVKVGGKGLVTAMVHCNQYDPSGEPLAEVYYIQFKGYVDGSNLELNDISFKAQE